jgi:putative nucleotidyltransferase with HDIG domain
MTAGKLDARRLFIPVFLWGSVALGTAVMVWSVLNWRCDDPLRFLSFLATAMFASVLRVRIPGITSNMSVSALFVLIGIVNLSLPEAVVLGTLAMVTQCIRGRAKPIQTAFSASASATALYLSALAYDYARARTIGLFALGVLTLAYFVTNTLPVASIISLTERKRLQTVWRDYWWAPPYYFVGASLAWVIGTVPHSIQWELPFICLPLVYLVHRSNSTYLTQIESQKKHVEQMNAVHLRTIEALALAIDAKDHTTHDHLQRVQHYAVGIATELRLPDHEVEALRAAAVLHDIGKLAVPEHIISKPGKLTRAEFEKMKIHPVVGAEILERVEFPYPVVPIVRAHHEKWNGNGYPYGLKGDEIPIGARILAVVDCLDALASDRQYRRALPLEEAMAKVVAESGTSFDPAVVEALRVRYVELERESRSMHTPEQPVLSRHLKIARGEAPAAGYENEEAPDAEQIGNLHAALQPVESGGHSFEMPSFSQGPLSLREILAVVAMRLQDVVAFDAIAFFSIRDEVLKAEFAAGDDHGRLSALRVPVGEGLIGWVAEVGKPIINGNPTVDPGFLDDKTREPVLNLALAIPVNSGGQSAGVLALYRASRNSFSSDDLAPLLTVAQGLGRILMERPRRNGESVSQPVVERNSVGRPPRVASEHLQPRIQEPSEQRLREQATT